MDIINHLKAKYNLAPDSYLKENIWKIKFKDSDFPESAAEHKRIQDKWGSKIGEGWYGIEMTNRMPVVFYKAVDEFLDWAAANNPNMEIHQIAQKFSWIKIYLAGVDDDTYRFASQLSDLLTDENIKW